MIDAQHNKPVRTRLDMKIPVEDRLRLRSLAEEAGKPEAAVVRDLVREAVAKRRADTQAAWGVRIFGIGDEEPVEAA